MKQIWLRKTGGPEVLKVESHADLTSVSPDEVLIDVHYSGINFADIIMRLGLYQDAPKRPYVPGYEVSGIVKEKGPEVRGINVGDQVVAGTLFGGYSSQVKVPQDLVFKIPPHLDLAHAAALPVNWITAHAALFDMARVRPGDRVLIDAATGGVGTLALQMLRHAGAKTIGLTSSPSKKDYIQALGATPMTHEEFKSQSEALFFDVILNTQGGRSVRDHYNRLAPTGRVIALGISSAVPNGKRDMLAFFKMVVTMPRFWLVSMFNENRGVFALNALSLLQNADYRRNLKSKWGTISQQDLKPHVDKISSADDIASAHSYLESKKAKGKILISWV